MTAQTDKGLVFRLILGLIAGIAIILLVLPFRGVAVLFLLVYFAFAMRHIEDKQTYAACED